MTASSHEVLSCTLPDSANSERFSVVRKMVSLPRVCPLMKAEKIKEIYPDSSEGHDGKSSEDEITQLFIMCQYEGVQSAAANTMSSEQISSPILNTSWMDEA